MIDDGSLEAIGLNPSAHYRTPSGRIVVPVKAIGDRVVLRFIDDGDEVTLLPKLLQLVHTNAGPRR